MSVQSVERAFTILQALTTGPSGVSDIAERTELPKSTVSRLLATLVKIGAVDQSDVTGLYSLGQVLIDLSSTASPRRNLVGIARPHLVALMQEIDEAAGLSVLEGDQVYYLDQIDADHEVQVRDWTGETVDAHVVSSGLVLMAFASDRVRHDFLQLDHSRWTAHSITDPALLAQRLEEVRRTGFAAVYEEMSDGLNSVAAPIFNHANTVIAAVHAHGPAYRFPADGASSLIAAAVKATAQRISDQLAGQHPVG